jgi:hypothetical protein
MRRNQETKPKQITEITDISLTAYLMYRGAEVKARKLPTGKVAFRIESTELDALTDEYYDNPTVPLQDFLQFFRRVKSSIYEVGGAKSNGK